MDQIEEKNGTLSPATNGDPSGLQRSCNTCDRPLNQIQVSPVVVNLCCVILSVGVVVAMTQIISLSFAHPESANIFITAVLLPVLTFLASRYSEWRKGK